METNTHSTLRRAPESSAFAIDPAEFQRLGERAVALAMEHLAGIRERAVFTPMPSEARSVVWDQPLPDSSVAPDAILAFFKDAIAAYPMGNGHPRFFGWVNSPPAPMGVLAELLAAALDPSCAGGDHAAIYLERCVMRWLMELIGFPTDGSMGLLVSGGSMATFTALAAARQHAASADGWDIRRDGLQGDHPRFVLYVTPEGHSCVQKSVELLGLGASALHQVAVDATFRMDVDDLRAAIAADRAAGKRPFCVVASAGTVATGAIDPLDAIADVCEAEGLWLHVDGAYGAVGVLDGRVASQYAGMECVDSIALDPHKWLSIPVECGCVFVRNAQVLRDTFSLVPAYIQVEEGKGFGGLPWYSEYGFQQTRGFRALKLWMTLLYAGRAGLSAHITRHNDLARDLAMRVEAAPDLEVMAPVTLSIVCFRYVPAHLRGDEPALDALNKRIMQEIQAGGDAFLTNAVLHGRFVLRACILHYATTEDDIAALVEIIRAVGARCAAEMHAA